MRIERLHLKAYGPFTDCSVPLCAGLNILYGPNEAGKSSALRAIRSLLYGIEPQTSDNFVHPYERLRIGAIFARKDGPSLEFCRRKGRKNTLRDGSDVVPLDDGVIDAYLGPVDEELFLSVFGIDHERLRRGGEEVVRGGGKIGELLFSAGGVGALRECQKRIEGELAELFKPGGQRPKINANVSELREIRSEMKRLQVSSETWNRHRQQLGGAQSEREEIDQLLRDEKAAANRLKRIQAAVPSLGRWDIDTKSLEALQDAPSLPKTFGEQLHDALSRLKVSQMQAEDANKEATRLQEALEQEAVADEILAESEFIQELYLRLGSQRKALQDRIALEASRRNAQSDVRETLRTLGRNDSLENIEQHRIPDDQHKHITALANRHDSISERRQNAKRLRERQQRRLSEEENRFEEFGSPVDGSELQKALQEARPDREIDKQIAERQEEIDRLAAEADQLLNRLPLWSGALAELEQLSTPTLETIEHFEEELRDLTTQATAADERCGDAVDEIAQLNQELAELEKGDAVPTDTKLTEQRRQRDRGWSLVLADWRQRPADAADVTEYVSQHSPANDLAEAFATNIQRADEVADRLRRQADRVATKVQLEARLQSVQARLIELQEQQADMQQKLAEQRAAWNERWRASEITPLTPREMRGWRREYQAILDLGKALHNERAALSRLGKHREAVRKQLLSGLRSVSATAETATREFVELVDAAESRLDELQSESIQYEQISSNLVRFRQELADAEQDLQEIEDEFAEWRTGWSAAMTVLHLPSDASPDQALSVLGNLAKLFQKHHEEEGFRLRVIAIDNDAGAFEWDVTEFVGRLAPDLAESSAEEAVRELHARDVEAREAKQRVDAINQRLTEQRSKKEVSETAITEMNAALSAMTLEAGCDCVDDLGDAVRRSTEKQRLQASVTSLEEQLRPLSGGQSIEDFAAEAAPEDADQLGPRIEELDERIETLTAERDELLQAEQHERDELSKIDGNAEAAEKATESEMLVAELDQQIHEYVVLRLASSVLRTAVERYREKAEGPIVERASEVFQSLTRGSFSGLRSDFDDDGQLVLLSVRSENRATLRVSEMSDGACDQLYLALRIATLEHWFEHHDPVPFIIDDVLLSFDDDRAKAALAALAALSKKTQIIFFTHHEHVVDMARSALPGVLNESEYVVSTEWCDN